MQLIDQGLPTRERESLIKKGVELMATNRAAEEGTDIVQKKVDEEEANNAEIGDQFWIYSGQRLEVERPKEELEKKANTLRDMIENVRDGIPPGGGGRSWRRRPTTWRTRPTGSRPRQHNWTRRTPTNRKFLYISISVLVSFKKVFFTILRSENF